MTDHRFTKLSFDSTNQMWGRSFNLGRYIVCPISTDLGPVHEFVEICVWDFLSMNCDRQVGFYINQNLIGIKAPVWRGFVSRLGKMLMEIANYKDG